MKKILLILTFVLLGATSWGQNPGGSTAQPQRSPVVWNGFELFTYLAAKFPVKIVSDFSELEASPRGILVVLGNEAAPILFWPRVEDWVRRGGTLLVATDEKPPGSQEAAIALLTGYKWGPFFLKKKVGGGLDTLSQNDFEGNQFVVAADWTAPILSPPNRTGLAEVPLERLLPFGSERRGRVFLNKPGYLILATAQQNTQVLGRLPQGMVMVSQLGDLPFPGFSPAFGCVSHPHERGLVIQLADQDLFNNQMLELKDNVEFAWWCLETLCRGEKIAQAEPIPMLILVGGRAQAPFQLPPAPLPLPDIDPYTAASLAARALDEMLPRWEEYDGPFASFSRRIASQNYLQNIIGIIGLCLAAAGIYLLIRYRGGFRARETAKHNALVWSSAARPVNPRAMAQKSMTDDLLKEMEAILKKREISFWEIPDLKWVEKTPGSDPRGTKKFERAKKEILGFICRNRQSLQNTKPSQVARIRDLLTRLSDQLEKGLAKPLTGSLARSGRADAIHKERFA